MANCNIASTNWKNYCRSDKSRSWLRQEVVVALVVSVDEVLSWPRRRLLLPLLLPLENLMNTNEKLCLWLPQCAMHLLYLPFYDYPISGQWVKHNMYIIQSVFRNVIHPWVVTAMISGKMNLNSLVQILQCINNVPSFQIPSSHCSETIMLRLSNKQCSLR